MDVSRKEIVCKNIYRNNDAEKRRKVFTRKWAELISRAEKSKSAVVEIDNEQSQ